MTTSYHPEQPVQDCPTVLAISPRCLPGGFKVFFSIREKVTSSRHESRGGTANHSQYCSSTRTEERFDKGPEKGRNISQAVESLAPLHTND